MGDTVVVLLRALVSLGVVLGLIWWAGRRLSSGKGPVGGSATGSRTGRATGVLGRGLGRVRDALRGGGTAQAPAIVVLGKQALTPKAGLALVEVGGRRLLLGVGEQGVTVLDTVPTLLAMMPKDAPKLRIIILGGEACPPAVAARWCKPGRTIFNSYGPTEATVVATASVVEPDKPVTIGEYVERVRRVGDSEVVAVTASSAGLCAVGLG